MIAWADSSANFAVGVLPASSSISASGGTVTDLAEYRIHTFISNGTFTVSSGGYVEVLVVAGGGGGGSRNAGGGGAGGLIRTSSVVVVSGSNYAVTVGAGGLGDVRYAQNQNGTPGSNSVFAGLIAIGGGYGGGRPDQGCRADDRGGSGGGGSAGGCTNGAATVGQGFPGGNGAGYYGGGGGGGAGGAGVNGNNSGPDGTAGGIGVTNDISGTWVWYAGGGGGGAYNGTPGLGGSSIGGNGGETVGSSGEGSAPPAGAGAPNTGSGGGGGGIGGNGGSGIVIIRYLAGAPAINNLVASNVTSTSATLNGFLSSTGGAATAVSVYWGTTDGGLNSAAWSHTNDFGEQGIGPLSTNIGFGVSNATYYYRYCATSVGGIAWADSSASFVAGAVTIVATVSAASEIGPASGVFTVTRPATAINEDLVVNYTVDGSASNGVDYANLSGTVTIPAGQSNASIVVAPIQDTVVEGMETVRVTLADGPYVVGSPSNAEITIADNPIVASSSNDFSNVQGSNNWYYGYYQNDVEGGAFVQLTNYDTEYGSWANAPYGSSWPVLGPLVWADGEHPDAFPRTYAVRRWVSTVSAAVVIFGQWGDNDPTGGNGVICSIWVNGVEIASRDVPNGGAILGYAVTTTVTVADTVDFVVDPKGDLSNDSTKFTATMFVLPAPVVANSSATGVTTTHAVFNGYLSNAGQAPTTVFVYWGLTDGGTNAGAWANTNTFTAPVSAGTLSTNVVLSTPYLTYFYRYCATNGYGVSWATSSVSFAAGIVPTSSQVIATGGTVTNVGAYRIHTFTSNGTFTVSACGYVDVLVVAGGGAGGSAQKGGGGAGGLIYTNMAVFDNQVIPIVVGSGGGFSYPASSNGSDSTFGALTAIGGGGGGCWMSHGGAVGGSGGGGVCPNPFGAGTPGQGWAGGSGTGDLSVNSTGGGGGGAGGAGTDGQAHLPGNGGDGLEFPQFAAVGGYPAGWFAGGGGGGGLGPASPADPVGLGGKGGGGDGGNYGTPDYVGQDGKANTGGGGTSGGSGIVIVRYSLPLGTVYKIR